jgi:HD-like signal output (HDOD) protein
MFDVDSKKMEEVVSSFQIPVKPQVLTDMQSLLTEQEPDMGRLATLVSSDVGLSSAILKIINSPFYGMNRKISEIKQAVMILGLKTISGLVTALLLKASFKGQASISLERFWDDSLDVANAMAFIGNKVKSKIPVDMLYTIGLFENCGIPLLALKFTDYKEVLIEANKQGVNSIAIEEQRYKTNHAVLGYYVASSWNLPKDICELILRHHEPNYLRHIYGNEEQLAFAALKAASNMVERVKRHNDAPDWEEVRDNVLDTLGLSISDYEDLEDDFSELL